MMPNRWSSGEESSSSSEFDSSETDNSDLMHSDDLGSDLEKEGLKSAEYFESYLTRQRFVTEKDPVTGALIRDVPEKRGKPAKKRFLYIARLKKGNQHRMIRPDFCKNVLRKATIEDLLQKLRNTPGGVDRKFLPFGNKEIQDQVMEIFNPNHHNNHCMTGLRLEITMLINFHIPSQDRQFIIKPHYGYYHACLALGLIPTKMKESSYFDLESGCIGFTSMHLRRSSDESPFAVFEFNVLKDRFSNDLPWYMQRKPWVLDLFNSFIGSDAEIGGALCPEGIFIMWREEVTEEEGEDLKTYHYYALNPTHLERVTPENVEAVADFFVELVRISGKAREYRKGGALDDESEPKVIIETAKGTAPVLPPSIPGKLIQKSLITKLNSQEKLLVARVDVESVLGKSKLTDMKFGYEQWAKYQRERSDSY
jgi:hypothetical protein